MDRIVKGIWIPASSIWIPNEIFAREELSPLSKLIAGVIIHYTKSNGCSDLSNEEIAILCKCSTRSVSNSISELTRLGYFTVSKFDGRTRVLKYCH